MDQTRRRFGGRRAAWVGAIAVAAGVVALLAIGSRAPVLAAEPVAFTIACSALASGQIGVGQSVSTLATAELTGTTDVWTNYVELEPATHIVCNYNLPSRHRRRRDHVADARRELPWAVPDVAALDVPGARHDDGLLGLAREQQLRDRLGLDEDHVHVPGAAGPFLLLERPAADPLRH